MRVSLLAVLVSTALAGVAHAQLYKWVDKDGNITYSDTPPPKEVKNVQQKSYGDNVSGVTDDMPYAVRDAIKRNPVTLFANGCGELCDGARALLATRGVPYTDRNPDKDPTAFEALKQATGEQSVPTLLIGTQVVRGFSPEQWQAALTTAGYPRTNPGLKSKAAPVEVNPASAAKPIPAPANSPASALSAAAPAPTPAK